MIESAHAEDARRRVPIYSLYSETREPSRRDARRARRAGRSICRTSARASTPTSTRWPTACGPRARHDMPVVVCDRPNPIGGTAVEGPMLEPGFESFVGQFPDSHAPRHDDRRAGAAVQRALRHRRQARGRRDAGLDARSVLRRHAACRGCCRRRTFRRSRARIVYPGTVLFEGTNVSEGRGTTQARSSSSARRGSQPEPFAGRAQRLDAPGRALPSRALRADVPQARAGARAAACQMHVTDRATFRPVEAGVALTAGVPARGPRSVRLARTAVRVRVPAGAHRHPDGSSDVRERLAHGRGRPRASPADWAAGVRRSSTLIRRIVLSLY